MMLLSSNLPNPSSLSVTMIRKQPMSWKHLQKLSILVLTRGRCPQALSLWMEQLLKQKRKARLFFKLFSKITINRTWWLDMWLHKNVHDVAVWMMHLLPYLEMECIQTLHRCRNSHSSGQYVAAVCVRKSTSFPYCLCLFFGVYLWTLPRSAEWLL